MSNGPTWTYGPNGTAQLEHYDELPTVMVSEPDENDILSGRGGLTNTHPGNVWYRSLVRSNRSLYRKERKHGKILVAKAIVIHVMKQKPPSRFLERSKEHEGNWVSISRKRAIDKTSQALRERIHQDDDNNSESPTTTNAATDWHPNKFNNTPLKTRGTDNRGDEFTTLVLTPPPDYGKMVVKKAGDQSMFSMHMDPGKQSDKRQTVAIMAEAQAIDSRLKAGNLAPGHNFMNSSRQNVTTAASDPITATLLNLKRKIVTSKETGQFQQQQPMQLTPQQQDATGAFCEQITVTKKPELESMVERISSRFLQNTAKRPRTTPAIVPKVLAAPQPQQAAQYCRDAALNYNAAAQSAYRPLPNRRVAITANKGNGRALPKAASTVQDLPPTSTLTLSPPTALVLKNRKDVSPAEKLAVSALTGFVHGKDDGEAKRVAASAANARDDQFADSQDDQFADPEEDDKIPVVPIAIPAPIIVPVVAMAVPAPVAIAVPPPNAPPITAAAVPLFRAEDMVIEEEHVDEIFAEKVASGVASLTPKEVIKAAAAQNAVRQTYPPDSKHFSAGALCRVCKAIRFDRTCVPQVASIETHPELAWPLAKGKSRRAIATAFEHCTNAHPHWPLWNTLSNSGSSSNSSNDDANAHAGGKQLRAIHIFYRALAMACGAAPHKLGDTYISSDEMRVRISLRLGLAEGYVKWGHWETTNRKALEVLASSMIQDYGSTLMIAIDNHWFARIEAMNHQERLDLFNNVFLIPYCVDSLRERGELFPKVTPAMKLLEEMSESPVSGE